MMSVLAIITGMASIIISKILYIVAEGEDIAVPMTFNVIGSGLWILAIFNLL